MVPNIQFEMSKIVVNVAQLKVLNDVRPHSVSALGRHIFSILYESRLFTTNVTQALAGKKENKSKAQSKCGMRRYLNCRHFDSVLKMIGVLGLYCYWLLQHCTFIEIHKREKSAL